MRIWHRQKKTSAWEVALFLLAALAAGSAYVYRQDLRDTWTRHEQGPVPMEITRADVIRRRPALAPETPVLPVTAPSTAPVEIKKPAVGGAATNDAAPSKPAAAPAPAPQPEPKPVVLPKDIPAQMNLKVPFILQAPFKIWDEIHEDACEEASALMLQAYWNGETGPLTPDEMDRRIMTVVDYQVATYGDYRNSDAAMTADIMRDLLGLAGAKVLPIASADDIRRQIAAGRPVIIPAAGKLLMNPNFRHGGPTYHMLVLKGYRADGAFVANDPGTRLGENYIYDEAVIMAAAHDWNGGDTEHGAPVMIIIED